MPDNPNTFPSETIRGLETDVALLKRQMEGEPYRPGVLETIEDMQAKIERIAFWSDGEETAEMKKTIEWRRRQEERWALVKKYILPAGVVTGVAQQIVRWYLGT